MVSATTFLPRGANLGRVLVAVAVEEDDLIAGGVSSNR